MGHISLYDITVCGSFHTTTSALPVPAYTLTPGPAPGSVEVRSDQAISGFGKSKKIKIHMAPLCFDLISR